MIRMRPSSFICSKWLWQWWHAYYISKIFRLMLECHPCTHTIIMLHSALLSSRFALLLQITKWIFMSNFTYLGILISTKLCTTMVQSSTYEVIFICDGFDFPHTLTFLWFKCTLRISSKCRVHNTSAVTDINQLRC